MRAKILLIEDDPGFAEVFKQSFGTKNYKIKWSETAIDGFNVFNSASEPFDVVVIDFHLPELSGSDLAESIKKRNPGQQILFATGDLTLNTVQKLFESDLSSGFLPKGITQMEIKSKVDLCIEKYRSTTRLLVPDSNEDLSQVEKNLERINIVSRSPSMASVYRKICDYKDALIDVLVLGESGTGKELVARALSRPNQPFFPVSCASFCENSQFLESELFGHVKGAFTDAKEDKPGIFELAREGVVFLDELHTLSSSAQKKLLRVLQEKKVKRLGAAYEKEIRGGFRVIFGTKPDLEQRVQSQEFDSDLYFRVNKGRIELPSLMDRMEDIDPLVSHFTRLYNSKHGTRKFFEGSTLSEFSNYHWPGNIRELESTIERLMLETKEEIIKGHHVLGELNKIKSRVNKIQKSNDNEEPLGLELAKRSFEKQKIIAALKNSRIHKEAAQMLGVPRTTLISRMERLGIEPSLYLKN